MLQCLYSIVLPEDKTYGRVHAGFLQVRCQSRDVPDLTPSYYLTGTCWRLMKSTRDA